MIGSSPHTWTSTEHTDGSTRKRVKNDLWSPSLLASASTWSTSDSRRTKQHRSSKRRKQARAGRVAGRLRRTWTIPLGLMLVFIFLYAIRPKDDTNIARHFLFLSYRIDNEPGTLDSPSRYGKGPWDIAFVCFYTIFLSFAREFIMQELLRPLARGCGIKSRSKQARFMEQMYTACYIAFIGPLGIYVMKRTPGLWYFETRGMYELYPHYTHEAVFKFYYLIQAAFWMQQVVVMVLGQEKRRKDFKEFVAHHIVTIALIALSYRFHFTYMGIAVYIAHDISDFFLAVSKSLNYIDHPLQISTYILCIAVWIYTRHYLCLSIIYSVITEYSSVGPFEFNWETEQYKSRPAQIITFGLLAGLQALNLFWLYCLFRSAYRYIITGVAKDDRSEAELSDVEHWDRANIKDGTRSI